MSLVMQKILRKNKPAVAQKAITLMEILVSLVLMSVVLVTLSNVFISAKAGLKHSGADISAGILGRLVLDPLQKQVRQDTWDLPNNTLSVENPHWYGNDTVNNIKFVYRGNISNVTLADNVTNTGLRRVILKVQWNETVF